MVEPLDMPGRCAAFIQQRIPEGSVWFELIRHSPILVVFSYLMELMRCRHSCGSAHTSSAASKEGQDEDSGCNAAGT